MWTLFTNLGDAAITVPVAAICVGWLALFNTRLAWRLVGALAAGTAIVGATKIIYAGWGVSIPATDFRVISGHAMLSTAVWTVAITLQLKWWRLPALPGVGAGMVIGALTGFSRIMDHSHSFPEVFSGWLLGALVAVLFLRTAINVESERIGPIWFTLSLLLVSMLAYGHEAPLQYLIDVHSSQIHRHIPSVRAFLGQIH
ncbi:phosphatase PAP2 family protein [Paraburkholderia fungorum]|uniref:phosphatase PAP2 family protein n=1 Tax=Paraburkholderia fungorum TaxID=134537 RepID=UPI0038B88FF2